MFLYTFPLNEYFAVISLLQGTHDELSSIFVMVYCHCMYQFLNFIMTASLCHFCRFRS